MPPSVILPLVGLTGTLGRVRVHGRLAGSAYSGPGSGDRIGHSVRLGLLRSPFTPAVWNGLLAMEQLDLEPLESSDWPGSGLPLGVLASVQAYTTDAAGHYQGRAHSPGCAHRRPCGGVDRHDAMVITEELLGNKELDPYSKCGTSATR